MKNKKMLKKSLSVALIILLVAAIIFIVTNIMKKESIEMTPKMSRLQAYEDVKENDELVYDENNNLISGVQFDAFFLEDTDGDTNAEEVRGSCNELGTDANFYMDLKVIEDGHLKDGTITINSNNFYFNTAIVKDNVVADNYISSNTKTIKLNELTNGSQALLIGSVRSGDYSSTSSKTSAIGNDTSKYSKENTVTFTGTYVDSDNKEYKFSKEIPFMVDWYGEVNAEITPKAQTVTTSDFNNLVGEEGLKLDFDVKVTENRNQLNLYGSYIKGTIPELNGYKPTQVIISGTNVTYEYNAETGEFTAQREAVTNENGVITSNGYTSTSTSSSTVTRINTFNFTVIYPVEAFKAMGEDISSMELAIPIEAVNKGYNNPNTEDGFQNPFISKTATGIVTTTWRLPVEYTYNPYFRVYVGDYMGKPYNTYVVSKEKPINIYNGISAEEKDDIYEVEWIAYTGTNGITDGIIMNEAEGKTDSFRNTATEYISMEELMTNRGIYFGGATSTLGQDGWIKVYDAETDALIETFTSSNWNSYSSSNPYIYENKVKHIRVETSATNEESSFYVYNIKELDDAYITENFTREEFDNITYIYSYLDGYMLAKTEEGQETEETSYWYKGTASNSALYAAPTSVANITIKENTISTKATAENQVITITTDTSGYNEQGWKNGMFLVKIPSDIVYAEINDVTTNNVNVKITAYDLYEENGNYFIKILTENEKEETYSIMVDLDMTPDPRIPKKTDNVELYAINEIACDYYYGAGDQYDLDGDTNTTEEVNKRTTSLTMDPGTSLNTTQVGADYGDGDNVTIAPRVVKTDKNQRTATIRLSAINNYDFDISDIKIQGVVPFEGNKYILTGRDLGSTFTTNMINGGIKVTTSGLADYVTVYYSEAEEPSNDIEDKANGWTLAENVTDWSKIKTYIIVVDNSYNLATGETIEFEYDISLPQGVDYNEVTYSEHAIYFSLMTDDGKYATTTGSEKLGFMIAKQYDLEIVKYQEDTEKTIQGVTFSLTEDGQETSSIKVTDANGTIKFIGLFAERYYTLKEIKTTDDYVLNGEEIRFYTYTEINPDGTESLYLEYVDKDNQKHARANNIYDCVIEDSVLAPKPEEGQDYKIQIKIENEVKAKLAIHKKDKATGEPLKNVKFTLTGEGKNEILTTDKDGNILTSGLYLDREYTLTETKSTDYYVAQEPIKFTITNDNGTIKFVNYTDNNNITASHTIELNDEIPTITLDLQNEKIPSYGLQLTKYAKGEKVENAEGEQVDKTLEKAQYKIYGEGISEEGEMYTTDENGVLTIDGLYEYVEGRYITGEYRLVEIYAPEGYSLNSTELKFKAYRENGTLKIEIIEGQDVIRVIETKDAEGNVTESKTDLAITDENGTYPIIKIGVEDAQIFSLYKYTTNGTTEKIPIPGTKFVITDLEGNYVTGSDGKTIGEWDETLQKYVVTTDAKGQLTANVKEGLYKAIEVYVDDKYVLSENEADRTYYFGIGASQAAMWGWVNSNNIAGKGWSYVNSMETTEDAGIISVGEFSDYLTEEDNGVDLNKDGTVDETSQGESDGIIVKYDLDGNYEWSKTIGGSADEALNKVIQTSDGGFAVVGYVTSNKVKYDGQEISELSRNENTNLGNKDAILLKLDKDGNYEWGIRFGGTSDDEIKAVTETSQKQIVVVGNFYSSTMNFYKYNAGAVSDIKESFDNLNTSKSSQYYSGMNGFVATYSETGKYEWSQRIGGSYDTEVVDVTDTSTGIAVAVNHISTVYLDTDQTVSQSGYSSYTSGTIVQYDNNGTYLWRYRFYPSSNSTAYNVEISSLELDNNNNIITAVEYKRTTSVYLRGSKNGSSTYDTIVSAGTGSTYYDASLVKITPDGSYDSTIYTLSGNYDDYISDIKVTEDEGILFGGWYYSTSGIDVDGDGETTGIYDLKSLTGTYTSDGFIIKLNSEQQIEAASRIYGNGYDIVTSVVEAENGNLISGGYSDSQTLNAVSSKSMVENETTEETDVTKIETNLAGNYDGFILVEGIASAEVPTAQSLQIENKIKTFKITTEVVKHDENGTQVDGGDITGEEGTFGGIEYSKDGIRYVETVNYEENSTKEIIITPDPGYVISYIKINDVEYTNYTTNADGTVTIPIFEEVKEDKHIKVEFSNTKSSIEVNHLLWTEEDGTTTQKVADSENYTGEVGQEYDTKPKTDIDYEIITNADYYGENIPEGLEPDDYYIPDNYTGTYISGQKQVINYYYKEKTYTLTVHHYIAGTNQQVPLKGSTTGETVADEITENLNKGYEYTTSQASEDKIDYSIYELVEIPENATGKIEQNTEVTYYYQIKTANLSFTKVAEENHEEPLEGTEFALYKLNDETSAEKDNLIDVTDVQECWTLVNTYTTPESGKVTLSSLPITNEYRLVETKASEGRLIADGQWKIEFMYGQYDENDENIITVDGTKLKITAIGNPPAIAVTEDGRLQIPNREIFDFPSSGSFGSKTIYQIGIVVIAIGLILLVSRRVIFIKGRNKKIKQQIQKNKHKGKH